MGKTPRENNCLWQFLRTRTKERILAKQERGAGYAKLMRAFNRRVEGRKFLRIQKENE
jgi:hypothetical protein